MIPHIKKTMLVLSVLCLLAFPAAAQEVEKPRTVSVAAVLELVVDQIENLVAAFAPKMEPHGTPTDDAQAAANQENEGLPDFGPGLEPHG